MPETSLPSSFGFAFVFIRFFVPTFFLISDLGVRVFSFALFFMCLAWRKTRPTCFAIESLLFSPIVKC